MLKKALAIFLALSFVLCFAACNDENDETKVDTSKQNTPVKVVDSKVKDGTPSPVGDVYDLPEFEASAGAPVIGQITPQANPDDSVMIAGEGFKSNGFKAYVYAQSEKDNGKAVEAKYTVIDDTKMQLVIDKSLDYGVYGVYLENSKGKGNVAFVNQPKIWFLGSTQRTAGEELDIYGENLTTDNKTDTSVFYVSADNKYCEATILYSDPFKITVQVPDTLTADQMYDIYVHNGHGGKYGFAVSEEKFKYSDKSGVIYDGKVIDVTEFGADPKDNSNDDTEAIQQAFDSAEFGDIVYFPKGAYMCYSTVNIENGVRVCGDGKENTVIICANAVEDTMFDVNAGPCEFINIGFWHKRTTGSLRASFIKMAHVETMPCEFSLKVTNCKFVQSVEATSRSLKHPIILQDADRVVIENNTFDAVAIVSAYGCDNITVRNNEALIGMYVGLYYHQNTTIFTNTNKLDYSNNVTKGKDILDDPTGILKKDNWTSGRNMAVQGYGTNFYIYNNTFERTGLPDDNAGEQIMLENLSCRYDGSIASATADTITMPSGVGFQASKGDIITITSGKGQSQYRVVSKITKTGIVVDKPWGVVPDSSSKILITNCFRNVAISNNKMDAYENYLQNPGATTGVQVYGSTHNLFFTNNNVKNIPEGICIQPYYRTNEGNKAKTSICWNMFDGNTLENCGEGIRFVYSPDSPTAPYETSCGIVFRRNKIKRIENYLVGGEWANRGGKGAHIGMYDGSSAGYNWNNNGINGILLEHISFEECQDADIRLYRMQGNVIVRDCKSDKGEIKLNVTEGAQQPEFVK